MEHLMAITRFFFYPFLFDVTHSVHKHASDGNILSLAVAKP